MNLNFRSLIIVKESLIR